MDITLINPPLDKQTTSKFPMSGIPVGIAQLAGFLREKNIEVSAIDSPVLNYDCKKTAQEVEKLNPKIVGISCLTENRYSALKTLKEIKKTCPNSLLILGGLHPTFTDELILKNYPFIDLIVRGEGEFTLLELIQKVKANKNFKNIKGISLINNGKFIRTANRAPIKNLDKLPMAAYDLFPMKKYSTPPDLKPGTLSTPLTSSRGCPMGCKFCATTKYWGSLIRYSSNNRLIKEIEYLYNKFGISYIRFVDDLFTINKTRIKDFCKKIDKRDLDINFRLQARVDTVNREILDLLKKAGCDLIEYGAECGSNRILKLIGKKINVQQIKKATEETRKAGIETKYFLIVGNIGEREKDTLKTFKIIKDFKPDWVATNALTIYPGTELCEIAKQRKMITNKIWLNYVNPKTGNAPLFTEYYSAKEAIFLSQLTRVYCSRHSRFKKQYRRIERMIGAPLTDSLLKKIIFNKTLRKSLSETSSWFWSLLP